ncbi:AsmA-like C-terminal domain-containing protein [Desulfurivibrio dismutans]|uniref:AsmA-like C-terminal domain-containing protein n=1 Tax=Desulfurivibrio dismutans TaxID=1398908 RepID=UPI0023DA2DD7|nr:AsmA-like C-terminal domain-containing protein [Desulfurivibrio alkaliphilus]MDF1615033.1 AsmA-like C-terminal domain-containing protein [Desulfurivibrio alkaliphilus]
MARKTRLIVLAVLLMAALLALMLPLLLSSEPVRSDLVDRLGYHLESEISLDSIELAWLPTPHLLVRGVEVQRPELRLTLPETHVYPSFLALLQLRLEPRRVRLVDPELQLDLGARLDGKDISPTAVFPPTFTGVVEISRGKLKLAATELPGAFQLEALELREIEASFRLSPSRLDLELSLRPSFGRHLTMAGEYRVDGSYQLEADGSALHLHDLFTTPLLGVAPLEAAANLNLQATGENLSKLDATLSGDLPCFLLQPHDLAQQAGAVRLDCGVIDLDLHKREDFWQLTIHDFEVREPEFRLGGTITRDGRETDSPHWEVDLHGRELNADEIMPAVIELFGEFEPARLVGEIVLGGRATRAAFYLAGQENVLRDPKVLADRMILTVEVERAEIMVPGIDLYLPKAWGELQIKNSILELSRAEAVLERSHGYDGSLRVGLHKELPVLELDLKLDADLEELRILLPELVKHPVFQEEMTRFPRAAGRAAGRLVISDTWHDFTVDVTIEQSHGEIIYDRLPWPLTIQRGRLLIDREQVRWQELAGTAGPHRLMASTGRIALTPQAPFVLKKALAELDSQSFYEHLLSYPVLQQALPPVLEEISGRLTIAHGEAEGGLFRPDQWRYTAIVDLDHGSELRWYSPLLAAEITSSQGLIRFNDRLVDFRQLQLKLQDSALKLTGRLRHQTLQHWQGQLQFSGRFTAANRDWLQTRQWLPEHLLPVAPLTLLPFNISWDPDNLQLAGTLLSRDEDKPNGVRTAPLRRLDFTVSQQDGQATDLTARVLTNPHQADFNLHLPPQPGSAGSPESHSSGETNRFLSGSFKGQLSQGVMGHFFTFFAEQLEMGSWRGEAEFKMPGIFFDGTNHETNDHGIHFVPPVFDGFLEIDGLSWTTDEKRRLTVNHLALDGREQKWQLQKLDLSLNDEQRLKLSGAIKVADAGLALDLALSSPYLEWETVVAWYDELSKRQPRLAIDSQPQEWPVTGRLAFQLTEFDSGPWPDEDSDVSLHWQPLNGVLSLTEPRGLVAEIHSAALCCLEFIGTWYLNPALGTSSFALAPACPDPPRFEKMLPCLGIEQDIISGDCLLTAELEGDFSHWQQGRVSISSPAGGRIMRMGLLARIFSLINLTDIFTGDIAGFDERGFAYRELEFEAVIKDHVLVIEKAVIRGVGLNLIARGSLNLTDMQADMVVLVAPFKTIDTIVSWIPFVGRIIGGKDATVVTIPVGVKGDIRNPRLTVMAPDAVGEGLLNLIKSTLLLPFNILSPLLPSSSP